MNVHVCDSTSSVFSRHGSKVCKTGISIYACCITKGDIGVPNIAILQEKLANTENLCRKSMKSPIPHSDPLIKLHPSTCSVFIYLYLYSLLIEVYSLLCIDLYEAEECKWTVPQYREGPSFPEYHQPKG